MVRGRDAAQPPRAPARRARPQPRRRPVPGPVRDPAAEQGGPRLPRLRRDRRVGRAQAGRPRPWRCPAGLETTIASIDTADGPVDEAYPPMSVTITPDRRHRPLAAATCCAARTTRRRSPRTSTPRSAGWTRARRSPSGASTTIKHTTRWARVAGQGGRLPDRRQHAPPRRGRRPSSR